MLQPKSVVKRKLPVNLRADQLSLFDRDLQLELPETTLLEFENLRISSEGILFQGFRVLPDSFAFPANFEQWRLRSRIKLYVNNFVTRRTKRFDENILWITNDWSSSYFHWLADALPRLYVMRDCLDELRLLLPDGYQKLEFVQSSLKCFGVEFYEFLNPQEVALCKKLEMPSLTAPPGYYNEQLILGVREAILSFYGGNEAGRFGDRLYISRSRASKRRILNEEEILPILQASGFQTIYPEDLSFEEQVRICSRARYLVSNHGAGLINMLFVPAGANVLELRQEGDRIRNYYFALASVLSQNYFYQTCETGSGNIEPHLADLVVDPVTFRENLRILLSREESTDLKAYST